MIPGERPTVDLNGEWELVVDPERRWDPTSLPRGRPIRVPGCWEAQVDDPHGIVRAWHRRQFDVPDDWRGAEALLQFDGVMHHARVWVNGVPAGEQEGGYHGWALAVGRLLRPGGPNELTLLVTNPLNALHHFPAFDEAAIREVEAAVPDFPLREIPHGKQTWYSSASGIWKPARLQRVGRAYLDALRVLPSLAGQRAQIHWRLAGDPAHGARLVIEVYRPDGRADSAAEIPLRGRTPAGMASVSVPQPLAWGIGEPNLYRLVARLRVGGDELDRVSVRFGMRDVETRDGRVHLNGEPIYLAGALDQALYPDTIATPPGRAFLDRQLRLAAEAGLNLLRCHISVPDDDYLDAGDEAGLLLWCELPSWGRRTARATRLARRTLEGMLDRQANHPSVIAWSIVNEDWGTRLRQSARDRRWLAETAAWLKAQDPTRLVIDNSACDAPGGPNFHVLSDLADFHRYVAVPDAADAWRSFATEFAARPAWLWSPHGDAVPSGDEPLVLSEFGGWGLPAITWREEPGAAAPRWISTGDGVQRPAGVADRFERLGLDRIWPSFDRLTEATQWHQFEALQFQVGELRRHPSIAGHLITELTDAYWEANGLLDLERRPKAYQARLTELNGAEALFCDMPRRDHWGGGRLPVTIRLTSFRRRMAPVCLDWSLTLDGEAPLTGSVTASSLDGGLAARVEVPLPEVEPPTGATFAASARRRAGAAPLTAAYRIAILPSDLRTTAAPRTIAVHDPERRQLADRVASLGHRVVDRGEAQLLVAGVADEHLVAAVNRGARLLLLARSPAALPEAGMARPARVVPRAPQAEATPGEPMPWDGSWITAFSWLIPGVLPGLPLRNPLDFTFEEVLPEHVVTGCDPVEHRDEVDAGIFVGWLHAPAALIWRFPQGQGSVTITTFRLAPESGPIATALLEALIQAAAPQARRGTLPRQPS